MIKREIYKDLLAHLDSPEISLLVGARQVGKTTLMEQLQKHLQNGGERTLFLNLDYEADALHFHSQEALLKKIALEIGQSRGFVFIDEIQRKEDAGLFLKGIYDRHLPYKFIVSGSGSLELKEKIHESLAGRKRVFEVASVSFAEFVQYRTDYRFESGWREYLAIHPDQRRSLLAEYLSFGGYPRIVLEKLESEKRRIIDEIYTSYVDKDIVALLRLERRDAFNRMMQVASSQIGGLVNISEWAAACGVAVATLQSYLWYAEQTFVLRTLPPYFSNIRKEIVKSPVVYYCDPGLRNFSVGLYGAIHHQREASFLFQNLICNMLVEIVRWRPWTLHFWRTTDKAEVDFVLDRKQSLLPIDVKYSELAKPQIGRSLQSFIRKYQPAEAWVVNLSLRTELQAGETVVRFLPFWEIDNA